MRISVWNAYGSNNSGTYLLVGTFWDASAAQEAAEELADVLRRHTAWLASAQYPAEPQGEPPLQTFAREHDIGEEHHGPASDDWPHYGEPPVVERIGHHLLLYVDYTVTMSPMFGEWMYRRGGRVTAEIDHAHHPVVFTFFVWMERHYEKRNVEEARRRRSELARRVREGALQPARSDPRDPAQSPTPVRLREGDGAGVEVSAVFADPVLGVQLMRTLLSEVGLSCSIRVHESLKRDDPLGPVTGEAL